MTLCLPPKLALVGLRGAGKTTVGRLLAADLGLPFVDLDEAIAEAAGVSHVGEWIEANGLPAFRELERVSLAALLAEPRRLVLSTGGGAIEDADSRRLLRTEAVTIWLRASLDRLRERVAADERARPEGAGALRPRIVSAQDTDRAGGDEFSVLNARRAPLYREVSRRAIDVDDLDPREIAHRIRRIWRG